MNRVTNIALIQFESVLADVNQNIARAIDLCAQAADHHANILCFPELFTTGYNLNLIGKQLPSLAEPLDGTTITTLRGIARDKKCCIIAPIALYRNIPGVIYNSAVFIDDQGEVLGVYDKNHLWDLERGYFCSGSHYQIFDTRFGKVGIIICYDLGFPEAARIETLQGAEIIFCPSAWRVEDHDIWNLNIPQRALENVVFLAAVNRFGQEGNDLFMFGNSKVSNPRGKILAEASDKKEEILYCEVDLDEVIAHRASIPYLRDRRPDQYRLYRDLS